MQGEAWPDVPVPAPKGPAARAHLERIRAAVRRAKPTNAGLIEAAITACLDRRCLQGGDSAHPGRPPEEGPHGAMVLFARVCADELDWDACSAALRHGVPPPDRPRKKGAARDSGAD